MLETRCLPLRNYLMKYVMPSLTEAMLECCKIKPDDPVDFLVLINLLVYCGSDIEAKYKLIHTTAFLFLQAEHLLQNNQQD